MESLVRSFVRKVHKRSRECPVRDVVAHLLPVLHPRSPVDVVDEALRVLSDVARRDADALFVHGGLAALAELTLHGESRRTALALLHATSQETATVAWSLVHVPTTLPPVLAWHHDRPDLAIELIDFLTRTTAYPALFEIPNLMSTLTGTLLSTSTLDDPHVSSRVLEVLPRLVRSPETARVFWHGGGVFLLDAVAMHRANGSMTRCVVARALAELVVHEPTTVEQTMQPPSDNLVFALRLDVRDEEDFAKLDAPLHAKVIRNAVRRNKDFVREYTARLTIEAASMPPALLFTALMRCEEFLPVMHDSLLALFQAVSTRADVHADTRAHAALVACATTPARALVPCFPQLVAAADPDDSNLAIHLSTLMREPEAVTAPLQVHGCDHVGVHLLHLLLGDGYVHTPSSKLGKVVEATLATAPRLPPYAQTLDGAPEKKKTVPTKVCCPITLEGMHCPVVASDGHTYELEALVRHARTGGTLRSPLTRAPLATWIVYNRALYWSE